MPTAMRQQTLSDRPQCLIIHASAPRSSPSARKNFTPAFQKDARKAKPLPHRKQVPLADCHHQQPNVQLEAKLSKKQGRVRHVGHAHAIRSFKQPTYAHVSGKAHARGQPHQSRRRPRVRRAVARAENVKRKDTHSRDSASFQKKRHRTLTSRALANLAPPLPFARNSLPSSSLYPLSDVRPARPQVMQVDPRQRT